jgi:serine/threonine protein kinase
MASRIDPLSVAAPLDEADPKALGAYRLLGRLGEGGMGSVYLAETANGNFVAVKTIHPHLARHTEFHARFVREVAHARRINSPYTPRVLDADVDSVRPYLVTAYVPGPTLHREVRDHGPLDLGDVRQLAINVLGAIVAFHRAGIVHRDIKPSNIILSRTGPKVIDLGISRALDDFLQLTPSGWQQPGTWQVMAPEQWNGASATTATDVFAWGCLIVYASTGEFPFRGTSAGQLRKAITLDPPDVPNEDRFLRSLLVRALEKVPEKRPTAESLLASLLGDSAGYRAERKVSPRRLRVTRRVSFNDDHASYGWRYEFSGFSVSADGRLVAFAEQNSVVLVDTESGRAVEAKTWGWVFAFAHVPGGLRVATLGNRRNAKFHEYEVSWTAAGVEVRASGKSILAEPWGRGFWKDPPDYLYDGAVSSDGTMVVGRGPDEQLTLWNVITGGRRALGPMEWYSRNSCEFSSDGRFLIHLGEHGAVLWELAGNVRTELASPAAHGNPDAESAFSAFSAFSPDSTMLALGGRGGSVHVFDPVATRKLFTLEQVRPDSGWGYWCGFSPDSSMIAALAGGWLTLWSVYDRSPLARTRMGGDVCAWHPDGTSLYGIEGSEIVHVAVEE